MVAGSVSNVLAGFGFDGKQVLPEVALGGLEDSLCRLAVAEPAARYGMSRWGWGELHPSWWGLGAEAGMGPCTGAMRPGNG